MAQGEIKDHIEALKSEGSVTRQAAFEVLVKIGVPAVPALIEALRDEDSEVRQVAAWALVKIGEPAVPALVEVLKNTNERGDVHQLATWILTRMGGSAVPALLEALRRQHEGRAGTAHSTGAEPEWPITKQGAEMAALPKPKFEVEDLFRRPESKSKLPQQHRMAVVPFRITDLKVNPTQAHSGETVAISFKVTNNNDVDSYYPVTLRINGFVVSAEVVTVPRRTTVPMSFTTFGTWLGDYKVEVNELAGKFTVVGRESRGKVGDSQVSKPTMGGIGVETSLKQGEVPREYVPPTASGVQSVIDKAGEYIEFGLNRVGDGIIFPLKKIADISAGAFKAKDKKAKKSTEHIQ